MRQSQILDVKEVYALAEDLRLMVLLDPKALPRVPPSDTLLKDCQNILVRHGLRESFWAGRVGQTRLDLKAFFFEERSARGKRTLGVTNSSWVCRTRLDEHE
jgi:hypothetical protein